ncbi:MAG: 2-amino-3-ketobutyrate coenzyme ligase [Cyanobacteria bacterium RYN_339]|nr:2-amino-3-ketobutyrate coenzyme ligase [Cyanobacteria bacterium RYN_339]
MRQIRDIVDTMDQMYTPAARRGLMYRTAEDETFNGRTVRLDGRDVLHFGSCSYLGLELHPALMAGAVDAIRRYGTQFSASRIATSSPLYGELESLLGEVFGVPTLVAPTTSLAHVAALPLLVDAGDAVILDQQVHTSVTVATNHLLVQGTTVEVVRHNRMDLLEARIKALLPRHRRIWYLADGVYSMFGDLAPMEELAALLDAYPCLHLYVDDAHGMSWTGRNGRGHVLGCLPFHERLVTATSLNKAFAAGGGALIIPDPELRRRVRTVGSSFTFSGPLQPPNLGAAVASARLHLSPEIGDLQARLQHAIATWNSLCREHGLPLVSRSNVPVRFIGMGKPQVAYAVAERLMADGIFPTLSVFPAVPMKRGGLRFALNLHQTEADLRQAVEALAHHLPRELAREGSSLEEVFQEFELEPACGVLAAPSLADTSTVVVETRGLSVDHHSSCSALDADEWDRLLGANGTYNAAGLAFLEAAFRDNPERENNWRFHYFIVREPSGRPILATFFTETWVKDDMVAPASVSREVERRRAVEPDYLVSRALMMGSMFSEGQHLYLDWSRDWRGALALVLDEASAIQRRCGATTLVLRDLAADEELDAALTDHGFARVRMLDSLVLPLGWADEPAYLAGLSKSARRHQRLKVHPFNGVYDVEVLDATSRRPDAAELDHYYRLYRAVASKGLEFNTFPLPRRLFDELLRHPSWEILVFRLNSEPLPVGFGACFRGAAGAQYVPMLCGLDYRYVEPLGLYRQMLRHAVQRSNAEGFGVTYFGVGAAHEKTRYGSEARAQQMYILSTNDYNQEVLAQLLKQPDMER